MVLIFKKSLGTPPRPSELEPSEEGRRKVYLKSNPGYVYDLGNLGSIALTECRDETGCQDISGFAAAAAT